MESKDNQKTILSKYSKSTKELFFQYWRVFMRSEEPAEIVIDTEKEMITLLSHFDKHIHKLNQFTTQR